MEQKRRILSTDPETGIDTYFNYDDTNDTFTVERVQDVGIILERNKLLQNDAPSGWKGEWHYVAEIPLIVLEELRKKGILQDVKKLKAWLNDSENRFFRVKGGRI